MSDLEGTLTKGISYWMSLNLELGMSKEEDKALYDDFMQHRDYTRWMTRVIERWKELNENSPERLNISFFREFNIKYLMFDAQAVDFVAKCRENYLFYVISGASWEFCALAKDALGFDDYFSTNRLVFDEAGQLDRIEAHEYGFHKERLMVEVAESYGFEMHQVIAMGDSENDFTMLNTAGLGILVGQNILFPSYEKILSPTIIRMEKIDYARLKQIIDQFTQ